MIGAQTLDYDHEQQQAQARLARQKALHSVMAGGDLVRASLEYAHNKQAAQMRTKQRRDLRTSDEVLNCPPDKQFLFVDGLQKSIYADRAAYYEQIFMTGRYHPSPYYPPADKLRVKTRWGHRWKRVIREPVPGLYADYPQYADGYWSRIED